MRKLGASIGSMLFFILAPGTMAGFIPWAITRWDVSEPEWPVIVRVFGFLLLVFGMWVLVGAFARFALEGLGTPAPVAPTEFLVVSGMYRHVRNPMYVAVDALVVGQALVFSNLAVLVYGVLFWAVVAAFVHWYEEPTLVKQFGEQYEDYRRNVRAWLPRLRPYEAPSSGETRSD